MLEAAIQRWIGVVVERSRLKAFVWPVTLIEGVRRAVLAELPDQNLVEWCRIVDLSDDPLLEFIPDAKSQLRTMDLEV